ncbi:potassium-transporting ATPase subunit C [Methanocella sp. CWC-04]|uniref:Potassium-transporting ATPase KdpC subunit n=1 Tax=Methanooceanicella nereidis TaxID=2052831 RepID=A0AAP2RF02_9EURY|nr:potassium-transporting ATPase subunit KdpC [Methanocella sp. CWC-04]MCD1296154.1 potassium-transporting ATPase subunit C [Methanocella sp. CWC-04]
MRILRLLVLSVYMTLLVALVCGVIYPMSVTLVSSALFPDAARGSPVSYDGRVVGSLLIGQNFSGPEYFHSRPSAVNYNASASGASNLGPDNSELIGLILSRMPEGVDTVPADAVLSSGSGLDPDISIENAMMQAPRVAGENGIDEASVKDLIRSKTRGKLLGIWGEPRVNVLELNIGIMEMKKGINVEDDRG